MILVDETEWTCWRNEKDLEREGPWNWGRAAVQHGRHGQGSCVGQRGGMGSPLPRPAPIRAARAGDPKATTDMLLPVSQLCLAETLPETATSNSPRSGGERVLVCS